MTDLDSREVLIDAVHERLGHGSPITFSHTKVHPAMFFLSKRSISASESLMRKSEREATLSDLHSFKDTGVSQLFHAHHGLEFVRRLVVVWLDTSNVMRLRSVEDGHQVGQLLPEGAAYRLESSGVLVLGREDGSRKAVR
jgi:hypothetical protein